MPKILLYSELANLNHFCYLSLFIVIKSLITKIIDSLTVDITSKNDFEWHIVKNARVLEVDCVGGGRSAKCKYDIGWGWREIGKSVYLPPSMTMWSVQLSTHLLFLFPIVFPVILLTCYASFLVFFSSLKTIASYSSRICFFRHIYVVTSCIAFFKKLRLKK